MFESIKWLLLKPTVWYVDNKIAELINDSFKNQISKLGVGPGLGTVKMTQCQLRSVSRLHRCAANAKIKHSRAGCQPRRRCVPCDLRCRHSRWSRQQHSTSSGRQRGWPRLAYYLARRHQEQVDTACAEKELTREVGTVRTLTRWSSYYKSTGRRLGCRPCGGRPIRPSSKA